jgi:hydroxylamine dehydrogenase
MNPMNELPTKRPGRAIVLGLISLVFILAVALVIITMQRSNQAITPARIDALANSADSCVTCHRNTTAGIVDQFSHSTMASNNVTCRDCHAVQKDYPGAVEHEGVYVLKQPTTAMCEKCHTAEVAQFNQSRHSLPAWVAYTGSKDLPAAMLAMYQAIPEGQYSPDKQRNAIAALEGSDITEFACKTCHAVGQPNLDGSVGQCWKCHIRHEFSLAQVRKPETCNACHIGPDHPQWEIYQESPHGISYSTNGQNWNWTAAPGTLKPSDFPAPTCATCHFSGFGATGTTHDTGDRLTWFLFSSTSIRRPAWEDNKVRMQSVCMECHNKNFVNDFYARADTEVAAVNALVKQSDEIMAPVKQQNLLTSAPFDQSIEFTYFELWHHWGRTAKFGTWMQGPDYTQWHGAYEMEKGLVALREQADQLLKMLQGTK